MPSVDIVMLRSEVEWFPYFLDQCKHSLTHMDLSSMKNEVPVNSTRSKENGSPD